MNFENIVILGAIVAGFLLAALTRRLPMFGWIGLVLLFVATLSCGVFVSESSSQNLSLVTLIIFMIFAPIGVIYSVRAYSSAPDRITVTVAFIGSIVVAALFIGLINDFIHSF